MYSVSSGYVSSIKARVRNALIYRGTLTLIDGTVYTFENKDIDASSGVITRKCSSDYSIDIGGVYAAELVISLIPNSQTLDINRYKLYGAIINLFCEITALPVLTWGDASSYQWNELIAVKWGDNPKTPKANIPLGEFVVSESMRSANAIKITAYDYMTKFDKNLPVLDDDSRTIFNWIRVICNDCGVACGMTLDEVTRMTNGNRKPNFSNVDDTVKTYRDLLARIAQATASVALIDRYGRLILKQYSMTVADTIDSGFRYSSDFSDYQSYYTGLSATYKSQGVTEYYTNDTLYDDGLSYEIGCNPFLQISNDTNRKTVLQGIIDAQTDIKYTPFKVEIPSNPLYDLMDVLEFTDNQTAEEDIAPITSLVYHLGDKTEIACNGADPALSDAVIKENRTEESLANQVDGGVSMETMWMNASSTPPSQLVIQKETQTTIGSVTFYALKERNLIQIACTATYVLSTTSLVKAYVYVDNVLIYETRGNQWIGENQITVTTGYELNGKGNHTASVKLEITDSTIDTGGGGVLLEKSINMNGLYVAADDGVYGYSKVTALIDDSMGYYSKIEDVTEQRESLIFISEYDDFTDMSYETYTVVYEWQNANYVIEYDDNYVTLDGDSGIELIVYDYNYIGTADSIDSGYLDVCTIPTDSYSLFVSANITDGSDNMFADAQLNLNNWTASIIGWIHSITYSGGTNTLAITSVPNWEDLITEIEVQPNTNYRLTFYQYTTTGYSRYDIEGRRCYIWDSTWEWNNSAPNLSDSRLIAYSSIWQYSASTTPVLYTVDFNSGNNEKIYVNLGFGDIRDGTSATMVFSDFKLVEV